MLRGSRASLQPEQNMSIERCRALRSQRLGRKRRDRSDSPLSEYLPAHQCRELTKRIPMNPGVRAIETPDDIVNGNALHRNRKNLSAPMAEQKTVSSRV